MGTTIPGYYTVTEAAEATGLSRTGLLKVAKKERWKAYLVGNVHLYHQSDVREYRDHRIRTKLVKALGWSGRGLYRVDDVDIVCPECGAFAVEWPAPPYLSNKYLCADGHSKEI